MIVITYYKAKTIEVIQQLGSDLALSYRLWLASKEFGDIEQVMRCRSQFKILKEATETFARFHATTKLIFTNEEKEKFFQEFEGYYSIRGTIEKVVA